ncbi:hypothetical protein BD410DRAFT_730790, partial [Rickenella mellea]
ICQNIGGLKVLQRFEVDACTGSSGAEDGFLSAFAAFNPDTTTSPATHFPDNEPRSFSGIQIHRTTPRTLVPQSTLIELKTRVFQKPVAWSKIYPQLYLSQTPYLYLANHLKGEFIDVEKIKTDDKQMERYMMKAEESMGRLRDLLVQILKAVRNEDGDEVFSLVREDGRLALYRREKGSGMSVGKDILQKFAVKNELAGKTTDLL